MVVRVVGAFLQARRCVVGHIFGSVLLVGDCVRRLGAIQTSFGYRVERVYCVWTDKRSEEAARQEECRTEVFFLGFFFFFLSLTYSTFLLFFVGIIARLRTYN